MTTSKVNNYKAEVDSVKSVCRTLRGDLVTALEMGDEDAVQAIKVAIVSLKDLASVLVYKTFDATIDYVHTTKGDDFLPNVSRIYQPRGRVAGEKKEVDPFA